MTGPLSLKKIFAYEFESAHYFLQKLQFLARCHTATDPDHIFAKIFISTTYHKIRTKAAVTQH